MSDELLGTILSAVIAGVFNLIAKRMELRRLRDDAKALESPTGSPATQRAVGAINYGTAVKHIGILVFIVNLVGLFLGIAMGATGANPDTVIVPALLIGTIVLSAGYFWSALSVEKASRWKHLVIVAIGVAITGLIINSIILQTPLLLAAFAFALVQSFVSMGIGGFVANTIKH